jgi:ATP-dependent exoDNAse (exonuclease V) alpha subunit
MTQNEALTILKMGKNVFLTGPAGSGKTFVLNSYIQYLEDHGVEVAITASTGIAATHLGGMTIHAWAGIGIRDTLSVRDLDHLEQQKYLWKRFEKVKVLIIDEISMLKNATLDMVDRVCKTFKRNNKSFGGLQVIFAGDFFQLPPVERYSPKAHMEQVSLYPDGVDEIMYEQVEDQIKTPFAFLSQSWKEADPHVCYLHEQYRQDDHALLRILSEMRTGEVSDDSRELLLEKITKKEIEDITKLYTHNIDVDRFNLEQLEKIDDEGQIYEMTSRGKASGVEALKRGCLAPQELWIKIGSLVMFVKNNPVAGYVNGTVGEVIGFDEDDFPIVQTREGKTYTATPQPWAIDDQGSTVAEIFQVPLKLAWAITIHKSQGMTLDSALIDLSQTFVPGQGYVALSRVKTLDGLYLRGINRQALEVHPGILQFDKKIKEQSDIISTRLEITSVERIKECQEEFMKSIGGDVKLKKEKRDPELKISTYQKTKELILKQKTVEAIAFERDMSEATIYDHIEKLLEKKELNIDSIMFLYPTTEKDKKIYKKIADTFIKLQTTSLKPVFEALGEKHDYNVIKKARIFIDREKSS